MEKQKGGMMGVVGLDTSRAIELAPRIWWVGALLPGDQFQCHVYLVEQGDQSVLIDPGSALTAADVVRKVDDVVGVRNVRWLVCSHTDPDIIAAMPMLVAHGLHPEAAIVTHWRDKALIRHFGVDLPYWLVEETRLDASARGPGSPVPVHALRPLRRGVLHLRRDLGHAVLIRSVRRLRRRPHVVRHIDGLLRDRCVLSTSTTCPAGRSSPTRSRRSVAFPYVESRRNTAW